MYIYGNGLKVHIFSTIFAISLYSNKKIVFLFSKHHYVCKEVAFVL